MGTYYRNASLANIANMSQLPGVKTSPIHASTETLNFQLAEPNSIPPTTPVTSEAKYEDPEKPDSEKTYLETEIDSYSGVLFKNKNSFSSSIRPPTPPKPTLRAFTFGSTNPFAVGSEKTDSNNALYTTVSKPKSRPKVPPKPSSKEIEAKARDIKNNSIRLSTTSLLNNPGETTGNTISGDANVIQRGSSLPNLVPLQLVQVGNSLQPVTDIQRHSTIGYGMINKLRANGSSLKPLRMVDGSNNVDYCDMIPESPPYINELPNDSENVYEDVKIASPKPSLVPCQQQPPPQEFVSDLLNRTPDGQYTEMVSPISDVNFTFQSSSIYENLPAHLPSSRVGIYGSEDFDPSEKVLEPPLQFSSNKAGHQIIPDSNRPPESYQYYTSNSPYYANSGVISEVSPSSSFTGHSSSLTSTVASSFQGIQVCYFPPQPPQDFYGDFNTCGLPSASTDMTIRPGSVSDFSTASSSTLSRRSSTRPSRSRIPVPVKSPGTPENYYSHSQLTVPEELAPPLPPTPSPSPAPIPKNKKKGNKQVIKLSPPSPPSGKGARWYEKLGCIQSDTIQPAEPYGVPGERKRSKSLSKEHRKSKFFVPVEPNDALPDNSTSLSITQCGDGQPKVDSTPNLKCPTAQ